ncbi:hypothetical protein GE061_014629 [Apolygus lucorum]|uniref:Dynamin-like GTPase OPA1, mitochondrial n=1 Tax=Apolygus lucorum TaxID=248454 RepID=A0A8S9XIT5_APOLU|nr:hypothetical protein GE061_014629 [Apolygus lucorum]
MYVLRGTFGYAVPRRTKLVPQVAVLKAKHSALLKPSNHEERAYSHWSQRQNPILFAPSSHQLLVWQPKFGPHGSGSRRGFGMFVVRALKGILKIRYLILGGAVTGGMSLQKSYQEWKESFPDLKWLESYMPSNDQVDKFRSSLIDLKDKVKDIEIDPRIVKIGEGKLTKMQEWLNQKINDAYEAAQKSELEGSGKNIARPIRDTVQKLYEEADNKVKVKALTFGSTDTRKDKGNENEADMLRHELIEVQLKYQKEIERLEKDNKELKKQLLLSKSSRTHHKQIKKSLIDMYSEVLDELNDYDSSYAAQDHLPRVVVVGDQSAGKTSVLEMIAQARIFPRGAGEMMTRAPVKVTLSEGPYHIAQFKDSDREFDLTKEDDLRKLRTEVELRMKRSLSKGKSVSQDVISMTVKGPGLQRMVLVDLPGIISTVTTDMAQDTRDSIRKMIQQHMSNPNAIILCIQDGSVDAERSNVTDLVAQMDPSGKRTIFVLTKVDMAEENLANPQRIQKILSGRLFPMKALGYFGVVTGHGRKEESIADIKAYEEQFFRNSKLFRDSRLSSTQLTTKNLSFAVAEVFWKMVRETVEQQADAFKATRFNLETEWKNTYPGIRELDRDELFDKARGEILDEVINLSQVSVKDWDNLLLKKIWEKVSPHVINNIYLPAAQSLNTRTFNTMVDIRLKEWAESELAGKSIEAGEEALRQVLIDFIEKSMRSKSNGDAIFDDLKRAVVMEALERHQWEDKGNEMLRMIQLNTLEDHCVNDKQQWDSAVRLLEQTLKNKAQETEEQLKAMVGPGAKEKWLYWKYSTEDQVKKGGIKNELEKVIFSDPDHGPTLTADELTAVRKNLQRAGFGEPSSEMILDTWPTIYAKHFISKSMLRAYGCRRGYYLYHHNQEEIECQDVVLFWRLEQMLKVTATALRQQVMNREARRLDKIIKQVLEDFSQDQELKIKLLQGRRVTLAEDLKRVRQIQEKLEEFIQALNKEKSARIGQAIPGKLAGGRGVSCESQKQKEDAVGWQEACQDRLPTLNWHSLNTTYFWGETSPSLPHQAGVACPALTSINLPITGTRLTSVEASMASNWDWMNNGGSSYQQRGRDIWSNGAVYYPQPTTSGGTTYYGPPPHSATDWSPNQPNYRNQSQGSGGNGGGSGRSRNAEEFFDLFRSGGGGSQRGGSNNVALQPDYVGGFGGISYPSADYGYQDSYVPTMVYNSNHPNNNPGAAEWNNGREGAVPSTSRGSVTDETIAVGGPTTQTFGKAPGGPLGTLSSGTHPRQVTKEKGSIHGGSSLNSNYGRNNSSGSGVKKGSDRLYRQPGRQNRSSNGGGTVFYNQGGGAVNGFSSDRMDSRRGGKGGLSGGSMGGVKETWEAKSLGRQQLLSEAAAILRGKTPGTAGLMDRESTDLSCNGAVGDGADDARSMKNPLSNAKSSPSSYNNSYGGNGGGRRNGNGFQKQRDSWKSGNRDEWKNRSSNKGDDKVTADQRERLTEQLYRGTLECLVCYDRIRQAERVWSCTNCHHVLHLGCIVKWVNSSTEATGGESGWRCPACQNVTQNIPTEYRCMCGKVNDPQWVRGETPHCCGQVCGKRKYCPHGCTLLCHPGACPPCCANVERSCGCGRTSRIVICSSSVTFDCEDVCGRALNCGLHPCTSICHQGPCPPCEKSIHQKCHCGLAERDLTCDGHTVPPEMGGPTSYSCGSQCPSNLSCGKHPCHMTCHPPPCPPCPLSPSVLVKCQCGKEDVPSGSRSSCEDPVVLCGSVCDKELNCGQSEARHRCKAKCHEGPCPPCDGVTSVLCRCHAMAKDIDCKDLTGNPEDTKCQKRCTKKRNCGKHKCNQQCCIEVEHICPLVCNKTLSCGQHKCERLCHKGHCPICLAASFEELHCECGKSVLLPPIPCGTRSPDCTEKCSRPHPCGHAPLHNCHSAPECPPCTVFVSRYCHGAHELRKTVPCHMGEYSCGRACGRSLPCGHKCIKTCHSDACLLPGVSCTQPCTEPREGSCTHPCAAPCHPGKPCPQSHPCQAKVEVTCECGRRKVTRTCCENSSEYQRIATSLLAAKMADVRLGKSIDTADMTSVASKMSLKTLECNDECKLQERNLRLAIGLQIANPDLSAKLHPRYSEMMKGWAKKDRRFCEMVHEKLAQLVHLAKTSKQKSRAHSFQSMGSAKRQFIHEYCEHFGIESVAYDPEPNRNIVATAWKDKCWLPSYSLMEVVARESGHRKVPTLLPSLKKDVTPTESIKLVSTVKPKTPAASSSPDDPFIPK